MSTDRELLTDALQLVDGQDEIVSLLLPVVDRIANERAAAELRAAADEWERQGWQVLTVEAVRAHADALDPT